MVADRVPAVDVALAPVGFGANLRIHLLDENLVAYGLGGIDLRCRPCQARLEIGDPAKNVSRRGGSLLADASLRSVNHVR
ncbi:hypothetical protein D9M70_542410 [compost metagenome]